MENVLSVFEQKVGEEVDERVRSVFYLGPPTNYQRFTYRRISGDLEMCMTGRTDLIGRTGRDGSGSSS